MTINNRLKSKKGKYTKSNVKIFGMGILYEMVMIVPFMIIFQILQYFGLIEKSEYNILWILVSGVMAIFIFLAVPYRIYLLRKNYFSDSCDGVIDAHIKSSYEFRLNLSFVPIIGFIFKPKIKEDENQK